MTDSPFRSIDSEKLLAGEDYSGGEVAVPPGASLSPIGLVWNVKLGRYRVRFLCLLPCNEAPPVFHSVWNPSPPKKGLRGALLRKYRSERSAFAAAAAEQFGLAIEIVDRMESGPPKVVERVFEDGAVEPWSAPYRPEVH